MKLIIEIPDQIYDTLIETGKYGYYRFDAKRAIKSGTPFPEGVEILTKEAYSDLCIRAAGIGGKHDNG